MTATRTNESRVERSEIALACLRNGNKLFHLHRSVIREPSGSDLPEQIRRRCGVAYFVEQFGIGKQHRQVHMPCALRQHFQNIGGGLVTSSLRTIRREFEFQPKNFADLPPISTTRSLFRSRPVQADAD